MPESEEEPCSTAELTGNPPWLLKNSPKSGSADGKVCVYQFPVPARGWPSALHDLHGPIDSGLLCFTLLSASLWSPYLLCVRARPLYPLYKCLSHSSQLTFIPISLISSERVAFLASRARAGDTSKRQSAASLPSSTGNPLRQTRLFPAYTGWCCVQVADLISIAYARKAITRMKYLECETGRPKSFIVDIDVA